MFSVPPCQQNCCMIRETLMDGEPVLNVDAQARRRTRRHDPRVGAARWRWFPAKPSRRKYVLTGRPPSRPGRSCRHGRQGGASACPGLIWPRQCQVSARSSASWRRCTTPCSTIPTGSATSALIDEACLAGNALLVPEGPPDDIRVLFVGLHYRGPRRLGGLAVVADRQGPAAHATCPSIHPRPAGAGPRPGGEHDRDCPAREPSDRRPPPGSQRRFLPRHPPDVDRAGPRRRLHRTVPRWPADVESAERDVAGFVIARLPRGVPVESTVRQRERTVWGTGVTPPRSAGSPTPRQRECLQLETQARRARRGLWASR